MFGAFSLASLYAIAVAVLCLRRGHAMPWLWIILLTGPIGATVYLVVQFDEIFRPRLASVPRPAAAALRRARADAERLDTAAAWAESAALHADRERHAEAIADARRALAKDARLIDARYDLGRALWASGRAAEAREELARVVDERPDHALGEARYLLARALRASGEAARARQHLELLGERSSRADFLFELATVEQELGDRAAARRTLRRIVDEAEFAPRYQRPKLRPWVWKAKWRLRALGPA